MRIRKPIVILSVLLLLCCTGCKKSNPSAAAAASSASGGQSGDVVAWGEVKYSGEYQISLDFPARVESVPIREGDAVKRGTVLITLSTDDYQKSMKKLKTQADTSRAAIGNVDQAALQADIAVLKQQIAAKTEELNSGTSPDLQLLQNSLSLAQKEVKQAQDDLSKDKKLLSDGVIAQSDYDKASDALDQKTKAQKDAQDSIAKTRRALQDALDGLNTSLKYKEVQLSQQQGSALTAQTDLDLLTGKTKKPYLSGNNVVSALNDGIVKEIDVVNGSVIAGQAPQKVIDLIDADSLYVNAEVPEEFIGQISEKSKVYIAPTADRSLKIPGHVVQISNQAVEKDGDRIVRVQVKPDEKSDFLKPGYTSDVHFSRTGREG